MSKIGIPRVYWRKGAWRFMCNDRQKALVGKSWIRLGVTEDEARAEFQRWEERLFPKAGMGRLFDRYEAEIIPRKESEATRKSNRQELKRLRLVFGECEPEDITVHDVYSFMDARGAQSKTQANHELALLKHVFRFGQRWGVCEHNPADPVQKFKPRVRDRYVTDSEFRSFLKYTSPWVRRYALLKYKTGLRQADLLALRLDQLQADGIHLRTSKASKQAIIPWDDELRRLVTEIKADNLSRGRQGATLFCTRLGTPYDKDRFHSRWQYGMRKAIKEGRIARFTEHDLRAKHATDAEQQGLDVQANLQHSDRRTTEIYLRAKQVLQVSALGADAFLDDEISAIEATEK
ncbi:tyrosine-type recombinase/integrase [Halomonas sp. McH1-25]|uniref:tyrosine-type recombinase/integrase n=1 Tax=unclassified Halomonas TaxID=2609666 RepID=UPI001EF6C009|nr:MULTISPECIES: tyrosine-type recombinase/integrase [unclassified Halomonas]MCG7598357.1 tyrosine-type recombinase/integrase [Halomonas sp. McH1-25]MCP1342701.1 tyrosine-type recombinase/integrase [Halomonas sp. FL8]MCP1362172.1 tyrosine-type recombinase/integrase [Halomonas sp. BBD45]MCP1364226.1 tyrosine-type recombinase/integrase [Halomonas sp. BBD48]